MQRIIDLVVIVSTLACVTSVWAQLAAVDHTQNPLDDRLRLNQIQIKGTHNSYHQKPRFLFYDGWNYVHAPLSDQLEVQGVRSLELDLHVSLVKQRMAVYHLRLLDGRSTCKEFKECLSQIRDWSDDHQGHVPVIVWIEVKNVMGASSTIFRRIEDAIRSSVGDRLITPDAVKGRYDSLREAIARRGWPTLGEVRGRVMFVLLNKKHRYTRAYTHDYTSLDGRVMFAKAASDQLEMPWAVVAHITATRADAIRRALRQGVMVITTACRAGMQDDECFRRRDAAIRNGAHIVKDDFPAPVNDRDYWLEFPEGIPARCNPVTAPDCPHANVEAAAAWGALRR